MNRDDRRKKIHQKVQEQDLRRQEQIARQSRIIERLVLENQIMMGLLSELAAEDANLLNYRGKAQEVLDNIETMRADARKAEEKLEKKK